MAILDMREATFCGRKTSVAPVTIALNESERDDLVCESAFAAAVAARLAAGIVKCTTGVVFVGGFDPKIQPVQAKRLVGFVSHVGPRTITNAAAYFAYRAALWELDRPSSIEHGKALMKRFDGLPSGESIALAGALLHEPRLLVLDRPGRLLRDAAQEAAPNAALLAVYGPGEMPAKRPNADLAIAGAMQ